MQSALFYSENQKANFFLARNNKVFFRIFRRVFVINYLFFLVKKYTILFRTK